MQPRAIGPGQAVFHYVETMVKDAYTSAINQIKAVPNAALKAVTSKADTLVRGYAYWVTASDLAEPPALPDHIFQWLKDVIQRINYFLTGKQPKIESRFSRWMTRVSTIAFRVGISAVVGLFLSGCAFTLGRGLQSMGNELWNTPPEAGAFEKVKGKALGGSVWAAGKGAIGVSHAVHEISYLPIRGLNVAASLSRPCIYAGITATSYVLKSLSTGLDGFAALITPLETTA